MFAHPPNATSTLGLILFPSSDPIPHPLVSRIQAGEFIELRDLLVDNISLHNQLEDLHSHIWPSNPAHFRPRVKEVPSLSSWVYCFCAYIAILILDTCTWELLAYCRLIIWETLCHGKKQVGKSMIENSAAKQKSTLPSPGMFWSWAYKQQHCWVTAAVHRACFVACAGSRTTALVSVP